MNESKIGAYRIIRKLGEGGMGAVFEALHEEIERRVAIKVLHPEFAKNPEFTSRFFNEARAVNRVEHPGLVQISDYGRLPDGTAYIVMELLKGESLGRRLKRLGGRLTIEETINLARQVADALAAAHEKGIVHRDLKPDNIMIIPDPAMPGGERTKLLDFGIAKLAGTVDKAQLKTGTNVVMGTPAYMSPEQCRGAASVDDKSDVYSLGVMLYLMLTGQQPFTGEGTGEILAKHIYELPPPLATIAPWVPAELGDLVHALLAKTRQQRPPMQQVIVALDLYAGKQPTPARALLPTVPMPCVTGPHPTLDRPSTLGLSAAQNHHSMNAKQRWITGIVAAAAIAVSAGFVCIPRAIQMELPKATTARPVAKPEPPALPKNVRWSVRSRPTGAEIIRLSDGQPLGRTPWQLETARSSGAMKVILRLAGYQDRTLSINLAADADIEETLDAAPAEVPRLKIPAPALVRKKESSVVRSTPERKKAPEPMTEDSSLQILPTSDDELRPQRKFED